MVSQPAGPRLNRDDLVAAFEGYGRPAATWRVGGEFERVLIRRDGRPVGYDDHHGIRELLEAMSTRGWAPRIEGSKTIGLQMGCAAVSLEPGGQVELSTRPWDRLEGLDTEMRLFQDTLAEVSEGWDLVPLAIGLTPFARIAEIPWVPKSRYDVMKVYLEKRGDLAHHMMKGTCSVQASFDYANEAGCAARVALAGGIAPLILAMSANSPLCEGRDTGFASFRSVIWTRTDPDRTGLPAPLREAYSHERWVDWLLDRPMMFVFESQGYLPVGGLTFRTFMERGFDGRFPTMKDWEVHQTCVFPVVRVKRVVEVRSADCVGPALAVGLVAMLAGLMYGDGACAEANSLVDELAVKSTFEERMDVAARLGLAGRAGDRSLADWSRDLLRIAQKGLANWQPSALRFLEPLRAFVEEGRSPSERIVEAFRRDPSPDSVLDAAVY
jgi:glutamate--cysteine ligase